MRLPNTTPLEPAERQEARALIAESFVGHVKIRQEGEAVYARLETDSGVLLAAAGNFNRINDIQNGSGGVIQTHAFVIPFPNVDRRRWTIPVEVPSHCGNRHSLTAENVSTAGGRWRYRRCGSERDYSHRRRGRGYHALCWILEVWPELKLWFGGHPIGGLMRPSRQ
jgi:hypothetical protein